MAMGLKPSAAVPTQGKTQDKMLRVFTAFTALFIFGYLSLGVVLTVVKGGGSGFGDTHIVPATAPVEVDSVFGTVWRVAFSLAVLGLLPVVWYWFMNRLGAFGGPTTDVRVSEAEQLASLAAVQAQYPQAHRLAEAFSKFCLVVLLAFGNFFLLYVAVRWGWGFNQ